MGTRGYYVFCYKNKWYVFYNHYDSYPSGLGQRIVSELKSGTMDWYYFMQCLSKITEQNVNVGKSNFEGLQKAVENPNNYSLAFISDTPVIMGTKNTSFDVEYIYTIDFDNHRFIVDYPLFHNKEFLRNNIQQFDIISIPDDWKSYIQD